MSKERKQQIGRRLLAVCFIAAVVLTAWRIVATGVGESLARYALFDAADSSALDGALAWSTNNANTLYRVAVSAADDTDSARDRHLREALIVNPADGRIAITLAHDLLRQGRVARADELAEHSRKLLPNDTNTLLQSARYWWERERHDRAIAAWGLALEREPGLSAKLFPLFLRIAQQSAGLELMLPAVRQAPAWYVDFFQYVVTNASNGELVSRLYAARAAGSEPVTVEERNTYLRFLEGEKRWDQAFIVWAGGLAGDKLDLLGQPVNGSFESTPSNIGFDWRITEDPSVLIKTDYTFGIAGHKALHIVFRGQPVAFQHIEQRLLLAPHRYRLRGRVRPDSLQAAAGLQWQLSCQQESGVKIGNSDQFIGVDQWRVFSFDFQVPNQGCSSQLLRLVSMAKDSEETAFTGEIWFDDLHIESI